MSLSLAHFMCRPSDCDAIQQCVRSPVLPFFCLNARITPLAVRTAFSAFLQGKGDSADMSIVGTGGSVLKNKKRKETIVDVPEYRLAHKQACIPERQIAHHRSLFQWHFCAWETLLNLSILELSIKLESGCGGKLWHSNHVTCWKFTAGFQIMVEMLSCVPYIFALF